MESYGAIFETPDQAGMPSRLVYGNWHDIGPHLGLAYRAWEGKRVS